MRRKIQGSDFIKGCTGWGGAQLEGFVAGGDTPESHLEHPELQVLTFLHLLDGGVRIVQATIAH